MERYSVYYIRSVPSLITFLIRKTMLLIVCMRIYGDRVVSSDLRGEGVDFILDRLKTTLVF